MLKCIKVLGKELIHEVISKIPDFQNYHDLFDPLLRIF